MAPPGETSTTTLARLSSPTRRRLSRDNRMLNGKKLEKQNFLKQDLRYLGKAVFSKSRQHYFSHGLRRLQHFSSDVPVRFMMYSEAADAYISLHSDDTVCFYHPHGYKHTIPVLVPYTGLTATKIPGCVVGWGPGATFTLLDSEFRPLDAAHNDLDIRVCEAAENSSDLVTAGAGNVCVWSVILMRRERKIQDGLQQCVFTHMALAPPRADRPHRAFVACGNVVTVVDLDDGKVMEHKGDLCPSDITAMVYCFQLDCLIIASQDLSIRVWGPNWVPQVFFYGHKGVVNSMLYCSELSMLISSSMDCTIGCWNVEKCEAVESLHIEQESHPLCIGGTGKGDTFFFFSPQGVDFWTFRRLYSLHCEFKEKECAPLRQIRVSTFQVPYPTRVLCVRGERDITLVAAETGAVLTTFKAKTKILCADYCLHKEILLVLTAAGTVLQANTLTNPITLMEEWKGRGQGPWQLMDGLTEAKAQNLPIPGSASCLALYTSVIDSERALDRWRTLQEKRGCRHRSEAVLEDTKNKFLIILGQCGGCLSVLKLNNGDLMCRRSAHNGQKVTRLQVYPESNCILSTGEDQTVVVWSVNPYVKGCLTQQLSVDCGQFPVYMAALGPQLVLTSQDPSNNLFILKHFDLPSQRQTDYQHRRGHLDCFTDLHAFPELKVFVSCSLDKTLCIWNEESKLIRTLQLNEVPESLGAGGSRRELFLGIRGDLYKMNFAKFLPHSYQQMVPDTFSAKLPPDLPIPKETNSQNKHSSKADVGESQATTSHQLLPVDAKEKEWTFVNMAIDSLPRDPVKHEKRKLQIIEQMRQEAFERYMEIIYGRPRKTKIDLRCTLESEIFPFDRKPNSLRYRNFPKLPVVGHPIQERSPVRVETMEEKPAPPPIKEVKPVEKVIPKKQEPQPVEKIVPEKPKPQPLEKIVPEKPILVESDEEPPAIISPVEQPEPEPKPRTPPRPQIPTPSPTPTPQRKSSSELPSFLKQFAKMEWFSDVYPDKRITLSPEEFSLLLLNYLQTCRIPYKMKVLSAIKGLLKQELLPNTDRLYQALIDSVQNCASPNMSPVEKAVLAEMLKMLLRLKALSSEVLKVILTLLAYKELGLRDMVLGILRSLGVDEAEEWLWPELEDWESELLDQTESWMSLHDRAECWVELWISKFKEHNFYLYLRSAAKWKPLTLCMVDVLNYFCSVQKEEHRKARYAPHTGRNDTVLLPAQNCTRPILRLGETHSMARVRGPSDFFLPPMRNHPFLIEFPLSRVILNPFGNFSKEDWEKSLTQRYLFQPKYWGLDY